LGEIDFLMRSVIFYFTKTEHDLFVALELMVVGMVTVFLILMLVVFIGNLIIRIVNQYFPEPEITKPKAVRPELDNKLVSVITAAVKVVTHGKGRVTRIEKL